MKMVNSKGVEFTPILCVDFDGVINSYKSGGLARGGRSDYIPDPPVPGALRWLNDELDPKELLNFKPWHKRDRE
jgi:hypothetical protein